MKTFLLRVLVGTVVVLIGFSSLILAERPVTADMKRRAEEYQLKKNKQNLTGWDGILFYCHDTSGETVKDLQDICEKTYANAAFLAETAKIDLIKAHDSFEVGFEAGVGERLILEVNLYATQRPAAVHVSVRAYVYYFDAARKNGSEETVDPRTIPRSGDLIFWEKEALGASSGTAQDLVIPLAQGIEQRLKEFFADYLKAQR